MLLWTPYSTANKYKSFCCNFLRLCIILTWLLLNVGWNYLSIPKLQRCNRCNHLSMLGLKLKYVRKRTHRQNIIKFLTRLLLWCHNGHNGVSNHQPYDCLLNRLLWNKTSKFPVTGLCPGNSPVTGAFQAEMASSAENVSIWWRHHGYTRTTGNNQQLLDSGKEPHHLSPKLWNIILWICNYDLCEVSNKKNSYSVSTNLDIAMPK